MPTTERNVAEMTDDEINAELDRLLGVNRTAKPEPDCPECGVGVNRPKCLFEMGPSCPRHELMAAWRRSQKPTPYCSSWERAMAMGEEMEKRGLMSRYVDVVYCSVDGAGIEELFNAMQASRMIRAETALTVLREAQSNADSSQ